MGMNINLLLPYETMDSSKLIYATAAAPAHDFAGHAECAERVPAILAALDSNNLTFHKHIAELTGFGIATPDDIAPVHNKAYLAALERASSGTIDIAGRIIESSPTYVTQTTYKDTLKAAGAVMSLVDHVVASSSGPQSRRYGICI